MKKGITLLTLIVTIIIIATIVGTITFSGKSIYDNSTKIAFATEISMVQEAVNSYYVKESIVPKGDLVELDISGVSVESKVQFESENIVNDKVNLYKVDYSLIDISTLKYGTENLGLDDIYLVSEDTKKVYYAQGVKVGDLTYYTLTSDLGKMINYIPLDENVKYTDGIIILPSNKEWTNENLTITVKIPTDYTNQSITSNDGTIGSAVLEGIYNKYEITDISSNGTVTVNYTKEGTSSSITYDVDNIDKVAPNITVDSNQVLLESNDSKYAYVKITSKTDNLSGVKSVKYTNSEISTGDILNYFSNQGIEVKYDIIPIEKDVEKITVVIIDNAGNISYLYITVDSNIYSNLLIAAGSETSLPRPIVAINTIAIENSTIDGKDSSYYNPIIPAGFKAVNTSDANWDSMQWNNGLVIEDENGNQFVWIPVDETNVIYQKDLTYPGSHTSTTDDLILSGGVNENNQVNNYGGFYIGRYEAGKEGTDTLVTKSGQIVWRDITYTEAKTKSEAMYTTAEVKSSFLTGTMWDTTMDFISNSGFNILDSRGWGNYDDSIAPADVGAGSRSSSGINQNWKSNNIYDLAGNLWEWNAEIYSDGHESRGGNCYDSGLTNPASSRHAYSGDSTRSYLGFRVALYISDLSYSKVLYNNIAIENSTINGADPSYNNPVIPVGFKTINTTDANWYNVSTDYNNGLVIEDENGNQFVWVPVDGTNVSYIKDFTYPEKENFTSSNISNDMLPSGVTSEDDQITNYGGFYIARYEAGKEGTDTLVSKQGKIVWTDITYSDSKIKAESMYNTTNVKSGLITGTQWDTVMQWFENDGKDVRVDSGALGNYDTALSPANVTGYGNKQVTGYSEFWKNENIYDIAGNTWEWTTEIYNTSDNIARGGCYWDYSYEIQTSYRDNYDIDELYGTMSFRVVLYVL